MTFSIDSDLSVDRVHARSQADTAVAPAATMIRALADDQARHRCDGADAAGVRPASDSGAVLLFNASLSCTGGTDEIFRTRRGTRQFEVAAPLITGTTSVRDRSLVPNRPRRPG